MLNIPNIKEKSKHLLRTITRQDVYLTLIVVCVGFSAYGLGILSTSQKLQPELNIYDLYPELQAARVGGSGASTPTPASTQNGAYVASKNGTKYHFPWCGSAKSIKEENKVWFDTKEAAEAAGYGPASNCPGL